MRALLAAAALALVAAAPSTARVIAVHPGAHAVPANLLRISIVFNRPPLRPVLPRLALTGARLAPGQAPFLAPALRTPDGLVVTVLFDPARLKSGLGANLAFGHVLTPGQRIALLFAGTVVARWRVTAAIPTGPDPHAWTIAPPRAGARTPLRVGLARPIEWLDSDLIAVLAPDGRPLPGAPALDAGERRWRFTPARPWRPGRYRLAVSPALEDAAGNPAEGGFETTAGRRQRHTAPVFLPFVVR